MARIFAWIAVFAVSVASSSIGFATEKGAAAVRAVAPPPLAEVSAQLAAESFDLALRYEHGEGVDQSFTQALALYCDAARHGEARAFLSLGWMFLNGRGVARDEAIAVAWLRKAADHGIAQAANLLRLMPSQAASIVLGCPPSFDASAITIAAPAALRDLVARTARAQGVDPQLVMAVIAVESDFNPRAVSAKNAQGLMQLMPETAARFGVRDPFDESENVRGGTTYLHELLTRYAGDLILTLAAYNAGEGAVADHGGVPPFRETKDYIARVTRLCACQNREF